MAENDFLFGLKFNFDPSDFLRGSEEAQEQLERTVAAILHAKDQTEKEVDALAQALSSSPQKVRAALKELEQAEKDYNKEQEREDKKRAQQEKLRERQRAEQQRAEIAAIRERTQAVGQLRDMLLSVAAISLGGHGLSALNNLLQETSERGVAERSFAEKTGTNIKENIAEEEGAYLSGVSSREEARQSIGQFAQAQTEYRLTGQSQMSNSLLRAGVTITPAQLLGMNHEQFVSYAVSQLRGLGYNDQLASNILEQSGLTSGGYTNLALHPDEMRHFNQLGMDRANEISTNSQRDLEFQRTWRNLIEHVETFRDDVAHDLEPWVKELDGLLQSLDKIAKDHPEMVRDIVGATAAVVALGGLFAAIMPVITAIMAVRALISATTIVGAVSEGAELASAAGIAGETSVATKGASALTRWSPVALGAYLGLTIGKTPLAKDDTLPSNLRNTPSVTKSEHFGEFSDAVSSIEGARYDQMGGAGNKYAGKYQMSAAAIQDGAKRLGIDAPSQSEFLSNPDLQEKIFKSYTASNEATLNAYSDQFRSMNPDQKLAVLAYAHNQGAGGAINWLKTGQVGSDAFGTAGTKYSGEFLERIGAQQDGANPSDKVQDAIKSNDQAQSFPKIADQQKAAQSAVEKSLRQNQAATMPSVVNTLTKNSNDTNINIQHMTIQSNDAKQVGNQIKQAAGLPNAHAVAANTGVH